MVNVTPRVTAIVLLLSVCFSAVKSCWDMMVTAVKLKAITDNILYIEDIANSTPGGWTDKLIKKYEEEQAKRNALLASENEVISAFAKADDLSRIFMYFKTLSKALFYGFCIIFFIRAIILVCEKIIQ